MTRSADAPPIDRCFLCNRVSDRVVWRENSIDGRLCECGLVYSDTGGNPPNRIDLASELHPTDFYAMPARLKAKWMATHCPKGRLIEVGCGESSFLKAARELGYDISGMDPHPGRAESVSKQLGITVEQAFVEDDAIPPGGFDVVYHCDLLSHFPDPLRAL